MAISGRNWLVRSIILYVNTDHLMQKMSFGGWISQVRIDSTICTAEISVLNVFNQILQMTALKNDGAHATFIAANQPNNKPPNLNPQPPNPKQEKHWYMIHESYLSLLFGDFCPQAFVLSSKNGTMELQWWSVLSKYHWPCQFKKACSANYSINTFLR